MNDIRTVRIEGAVTAAGAIVGICLARRSVRFAVFSSVVSSYRMAGRNTKDLVALSEIRKNGN